MAEQGIVLQARNGRERRYMLLTATPEALVMKVFGEEILTPGVSREIMAVWYDADLDVFKFKVYDPAFPVVEELCAPPLLDEAL